MDSRTLKQVRITHRFNASPERVFDAWLDPKTAGKWLFATPAGQMIRVEIDARVGGKFNIVERRADGDILHTGEYLEIDRPRRLAFSFRVPDRGHVVERVTIDIEPVEGGSLLTLHHSAPDTLFERYTNGWGTILDGLEFEATGRKRTGPPGTYARLVGGGFRLHFERIVKASPAQVWAALTDPKIARNWLGDIAIDPRVGGAYIIKFRNYDVIMTGTITAIEPQRLLAYTWLETYGAPQSEVRWTLEPAGPSCKLTLTHDIPKDSDASDVVSFGAGWHFFLDMVERAAKGEWVEEEEGFEKMLQEIYKPAFEAAGGMVPEQPPVYVRVKQQFSASPERVFDAWLDPKMLGQFMFGPALRDEETLHLKLDARVGGKFSFLVRRQGQDVDHIGTYLEIKRPRRLIFTWGVAGSGGENALSRVTLDIVPKDGGAQLTLTHLIDPAWADYKERTQQGWTAIVGALKRVLG